AVAAIAYLDRTSRRVRPQFREQPLGSQQRCDPGLEVDYLAARLRPLMVQCLDEPDHATLDRGWNAVAPGGHAEIAAQAGRGEHSGGHFASRSQIAGGSLDEVKQAFDIGRELPGA